VPTHLAQDQNQADDAHRRHEHPVPVRLAGQGRSVSGQQKHQAGADRERRFPVTRRRPAALLAGRQGQHEQQLSRHHRLDRGHRPDLKCRGLGADPAEIRQPTGQPRPVSHQTAEQRFDARRVAQRCGVGADDDARRALLQERRQREQDSGRQSQRSDGDHIVILTGRNTSR